MLYLKLHLQTIKEFSNQNMKIYVSNMLHIIVKKKMLYIKTNMWFIFDARINPQNHI
jgi:hypothetical protein